MKQYKIIAAYKTLEVLTDNEHLTKSDQWRLYKLRQKLRSHAEFQQEQEEIIRNKYLPFADEKGTLPTEKSKEYIKELEELANLEVEVKESEKPVIQIAEGMNFKVMEPLEDFIEFTE